MSEQDKLSARMRALAQQMKQSAVPHAELEAQLCQSFRRYHFRRRIWRAVAVAGVAACLTIMFAAATIGFRRSLAVPDRVAEATPVETSVQAKTPEPEMRSESPAPERPAVRSPVKRRALPRRQPDAAEVMTGFLPVGFGPTLRPGERGSLVRVRLPRSALVSFGLPVNENRSGEVVNADVLLGEDGLARAIRFVQ